MLQKVNKGLCICSIILAVIQAGAIFTSNILLITPVIVLAGVCMSTVSWIVAQWTYEDAAIRTATIALVIFLLSETIWGIQMFSLLKILL